MFEYYHICHHHVLRLAANRTSLIMQLTMCCERATVRTVYFIARFTGVEILSENLAALRGYPRTGCSSGSDSSGESAGNGILGSSREVVDRCRLKS